jgi:ribose transport system permease protein
MTIGLVFVMSAGEIDLSIGSIVAVAALAAAVAINAYGMVAGVLAGLGAGLVIGLLNGALVAYVKLPSFLVTLATLGLFAGVSRSMTDLRSIPVTNETFTGFFGSGALLGVPSLIWWTVIAVAIGHLVFRETRFGAHVLATGDNSRAASVSGISVSRIRLAVLTISGGLAGLAGLLYAGRLQAAKYTLGETDLMTVIAAVIVGGTLLNGGKGSIVGALVGSLMMGMLNNGLILMGLSVSDQMIVRGLIILAAVAVSLREKSR